MTKTELREFGSIGDLYGKKLKDMGIQYVDDFFELTPSQIIEITGVDKERVEQWFNVLNLYSIPKVSVRDAELLFNVNVNSVEELSHRQASRIYYKLKNLEEHTYFIILTLPTFSTIDEWIYFSKLMTKNTKYGLNIPLISLSFSSLMNLERALELKKYNIFTIEDFMNKNQFVKNMRRRLKLSKNEYKDLLNIIEMLKIDGIDVNIVRKLLESGIKNLEKLNKAKIDSILKDTIDTKFIEEIKKNLKRGV